MFVVVILDESASFRMPSLELIVTNGSLSGWQSLRRELISETVTLREGELQNLWEIE
jgi:hypothetical protein